MPRNVFPATIDEAMERSPTPWALQDDGGGFSSVRDARGGCVTFPLPNGVASAIVEAVNARHAEKADASGPRDPLVGGRW